MGAINGGPNMQEKHNYYGKPTPLNILQGIQNTQ